MSAFPTSAPAQTPEKPRPVIVPEPPRKSRSWLWVVVVAAIVAGAVYGYRALTKPAQPKVAVAAVHTAKAAVAPLQVTLRMSGPTAARNFSTITAPILRGPDSRGSLVLLNLVPSGTIVKKGQVVAKLDGQSLQDHIDDLRDTVLAAENDVQKRTAEQKVEWEDMQQTLRVTKSQFDKAKLEFSAGEVKTEVERELLGLSMDEAQAQYNEQMKDVAFRKASQDAELKILQITLERHKRHMGRHQRDLERYTIYAPMSGLAVMATVFRGGEMGQVQQGDQVFPGQQIMKVVDTSSMQAEGNVSQADSGELRLGQNVNVGFDAFPDLKLKGRVYSIGALAVGGWRENFYIRNVPVRVQIDGSDPRLIPDLSAHCDIILKTVPDQLQIPAGAVNQENGKPVVYVKTASGFQRRVVTLGSRSNTRVAVLAGLSAGDEVRIP